MIPLPPDPWKMLGVEKNADKSEIRSAYKKLVLKTHPDKVQDPTLKAEKQEQFQKIQQAYELLNDDSERTKYEEQVQLMELRKQAALLSKNMPNSSSPRTKTYTYEIRNAVDPKHKSSSGGGKVYEHYSSPHTRSHEEVASRVYAVYEDGEKHARRAASYEKPSRRDDEKRDKDERRRKREDEERREREKEKEREREKKEKRKQRELEEKLRDKERRRERKPYVEDYSLPEEEVYSAASKLDKKRSPSRKHSEYREKSMSRRDRESSPAVEIVEPSNKTKDQALKETAADYIARSRGGAPTVPPAFHRSQTEPFHQPPVVPTPPPVDLDESLHRAARSAARRPSHDSPRERSSLHKQSSREAYIIDAAAPKGRPIPSFSKSSSTPSIVPESPPRPSRSNTVPFSEFSRATPPTFARSQTWANTGEDHHPDYYNNNEYDESEDDHARRHRRSSRRTRSPEVAPYRQYEAADRPKSSKHDSYSYSQSPTSSRRYTVEPAEASGGYPTTIPFRSVKEAKRYEPEDVAYASIPYTYKVSDQYTNPVYA